MQLVISTFIHYNHVELQHIYNDIIRSHVIIMLHVKMSYLACRDRSKPPQSNVLFCEKH